MTEQEPKAGNRRRSGSIADVGWRFRVFRISSLEMVAQSFPKWNRLADGSAGFGTSRTPHRLTRSHTACGNNKKIVRGFDRGHFLRTTLLDEPGGADLFEVDRGSP